MSNLRRVILFGSVHKKRFLHGKNRKLQDRASRPYRVLKCVGEIAYILDLTVDMGISVTFKIADLDHYQGDRRPISLGVEPLSITKHIL